MKMNNKIMQKLAKSEELKFAGNYEEALKIAEELLIEDPECIEAAEEIADNLISLGKTKEAKKTAEYVLSVKENSYIANFVLGFIFSQEEKWKNSIEHLEKSNRLHKNSSEVLRNLGWSLFHSGKKEEGLSILRKAVTINSNRISTLTDFSLCLLQSKRIKEAVEILSMANKIDPQNKKVIELVDLAEKLVNDITKSVDNDKEDIQ